MRHITWLDEILPWRDWKGWCMALALVFFWGLVGGEVKREELKLLQQYEQRQQMQQAQ